MTIKTDITDERIIEEYIQAYESEPKNYRSNAVKTLDWLAKNQPLRAWKVVTELICISTNDSLNAFIAAGPVEDLLVYHPEIIDRIEEEAIGNEKLCEVLDGVWQNRMSDEIWKRLRRIIDIQFKDKNLTMQKILRRQGYDVEEDGFVGPKTKQAINQLREKTGLPLESVEEIIEELENYENR